METECIYQIRTLGIVSDSVVWPASTTSHCIPIFLLCGCIYRVSPKKVSIKNFYSDLFTASIQFFKIYLDLVYLSFV